MEKEILINGIKINNKTNLPEGYIYNESKNGLIKNIIPENTYSYNNDGVYKLIQKGKTVYEEYICSEIAIRTISYNVEQEILYVEFQVYNDTAMEIQEFSIQYDEVATQTGIQILKQHGVNGTTKNIIEYIDMLIKADNLALKVDKNIINRSSGAAKYGFSIDNDLNIDINNFVGIDSKIMIDPGFKVLDKTLFVKKGTIEDDIAFLNKLFNAATDDYCRHIFRAACAIAVTGPLKQLIGASLPLGSYGVVGGSGTGKGLSAGLIQKFWGKVYEGGIRFSSDSTAAGLKPTRTHLNVIPTIIDDVQDLITQDKGIKELKAIVYGVTNSANAQKATAGGKKRQDDFRWEAMNVMYGETNSFLSVDIDGAANRFWLLNSHKVQGEYLTKEKPSRYSDITKTYGHLGPAFVIKLREYAKTHDIEAEFLDLADKYEKRIRYDKKAKLAAILEYAFNLLVDFELMPKGTYRMTMDEVLIDYTEDNVVTSDEIIYNSFIDKVLSNKQEFPDKEKKMKQDDYDELKTKGITIKGKMFIEDSKYKVFITQDAFVQMIKEIAKMHDLEGVVPDIGAWKNRGWAEYDKSGRKAWQTTNISYEYNKDNPLSATREKCYKIILGPVDKDIFNQPFEPLKDCEVDEALNFELSKKKQSMMAKGAKSEEADMILSLLHTKKVPAEKGFLFN